MFQNVRLSFTVSIGPITAGSEAHTDLFCTFPETDMAPCIERVYPAPITIGYQTHTHAFDYQSEAVHSTVLWGNGNTRPTGWHVVDFHLPFATEGSVWQNQMCLALEASSTVSLKIQHNGRVLVKIIYNQ